MGEEKKGGGFFGLPSWMKIGKDTPAKSTAEMPPATKKPETKPAQIAQAPLHKKTGDGTKIEVAPEAEVGAHLMIDWKEMSENLQETREKIKSFRDLVNNNILKIKNFSGVKNLENFSEEIKQAANQATLSAMALNDLAEEEKFKKKIFPNATKFIEIAIESNFTLKDILVSLDELCRQITTRLQSLYNHLDDRNNSLEIALGMAALKIGLDDLDKRPAEIFTKKDLEPFESGLEILIKQLEDLAEKMKKQLEK